MPYTVTDQDADFEKTTEANVRIVFSDDRYITFKVTRGTLDRTMTITSDEEGTTPIESIDMDNTIRFREPEVLFDTGDRYVKQRFKDILDDFFPRYVRILSLPKYKANIEEIRIEGHTSSSWQSASTLESRYLGNAELSQARAFEVLKYCFNQKDMALPPCPHIIFLFHTSLPASPDPAGSVSHSS